jgi:hypothetical protein
MFLIVENYVDKNILISIGISALDHRLQKRKQLPLL